MTKSNTAINFFQNKVKINIFKRVLTKNEAKYEKIRIRKSEFFGFLCFPKTPSVRVKEALKGYPEKKTKLNDLVN